MLLRTLILVLALMGLTTLSVPAATFFTDSSNPAFNGAVDQDFSSVPVQTYSVLDVPGITITAPAYNFSVYNYSGQYNTTGNSLSNDVGFYGTDAPEMVFNFSAAQAVVGFTYGAQNETWTFAAYDVLNNLIASTTVDEGQGFIGIQDLSGNIAKVTYTAENGAGDFIFFDDLLFSEVPEPSQWGWMLSLGLIGLIAHRRLRNHLTI